MNLQEHKNESQRTWNAPESLTPKQIEILHCIMGMETEAGELTDQLKKHLMYRADLDVTNIKEEIGDLMWYMSNLARILGFDIEEALQMNIDKLYKRYPKGYNDKDATERDLGEERKTLEGNG